MPRGANMKKGKGPGVGTKHGSDKAPLHEDVKQPPNPEEERGKNEEVAEEFDVE